MSLTLDKFEKARKLKLNMPVHITGIYGYCQLDLFGGLDILAGFYIYSKGSMSQLGRYSYTMEHI